MSTGRVDVSELKTRVDLVTLVCSRGVELKRSGAQYVGPCPFHNDRTPSFFVHPERGFFCHGCGAKGDAVEFIKLMDSVEFSEALERLAEFAGGNLRHESVPVRPPCPRPDPVRDAAALWERFPLRDPIGEQYLVDRSILPAPIPSNVLRFNVPGVSGDPWVEARAREDYRIAFAVRTPAGQVQTVSFRRVTQEEPKKLCLAGCPTSGAAICLPEITFLSTGDPEFARDRILLLEGGTSWLGAELFFGEAAANEEIPPVWILGVIGAMSAPGVIEAFRRVIHWRTVFLGFDADDTGERAAAAAIEAARRAGAKRVLRLKPPDGLKDWADVAAGRRS